MDTREIAEGTRVLILKPGPHGLGSVIRQGDGGAKAGLTDVRLDVDKLVYTVDTDRVRVLDSITECSD